MKNGTSLGLKAAGGFDEFATGGAAFAEAGELAGAVCAQQKQRGANSALATKTFLILLI